jgi:hypothetical protein
MHLCRAGRKGERGDEGLTHTDHEGVRDPVVRAGSQVVAEGQVARTPIGGHGSAVPHKRRTASARLAVRSIDVVRGVQGAPLTVAVRNPTSWL